MESYLELEVESKKNMRQAMFNQETYPDLIKDINPQIHEALENLSE